MLFKFCFVEQWIWKMPDTLVLANVSDEEESRLKMHAPCTHGNWNAKHSCYGKCLGPKNTRQKCKRHAHMAIFKQLLKDACARARLRPSLEPKWLRKNITIIECKYNTSYMHLQHKRKTRTHTGCLSRRRTRTSLGPTCFLTNKIIT